MRMNEEIREKKRTRNEIESNNNSERIEEKRKSTHSNQPNNKKPFPHALILSTKNSKHISSNYIQ